MPAENDPAANEDTSDYISVKTDDLTGMDLLLIHNIILTQEYKNVATHSLSLFVVGEAIGSNLFNLRILVFLQIADISNILKVFFYK